MAQKTRAQMVTANDSLFTANGVKAITGPLENTFNKDFIDSVNFLPVVVSGNTTAENGQTYVNVASATYTDPTPAEGKGYTVIVRNGTATVGGTAYATAGTIINRIFHSGSWANYVFYANNTGQDLSGDSALLALFAPDGTAITAATINAYYFTIIGQIARISIYGNLTYSALGSGTLTIPVPTTVSVGSTYVAFSVSFRVADFITSITELYVEKQDANNLTLFLDAGSNGSYDFSVIADISIA
jgi:hypothetical protein